MDVEVWLLIYLRLVMGIIMDGCKYNCIEIPKTCIDGIGTDKWYIYFFKVTIGYKWYNLKYNVYLLFYFNILPVSVSWFRVDISGGWWWVGSRQPLWPHQRCCVQPHRAGVQSERDLRHLQRQGLPDRLAHDEIAGRPGGPQSDHVHQVQWLVLACSYSPVVYSDHRAFFFQEYIWSRCSHFNSNNDDDDDDDNW